MENEDFKPLNLTQRKDVLERIRQFEGDLSKELNEPISVVAYTAEGAKELGHS